MTVRPIDTDVLDLDALGAEHAGYAKLFGEKRPVRQMDGAGYHIAAQIDAGTGTLDDQYALAGRCVPSLTPEQVQQLTARQVGAIIALACGAVRQVEEKHPNADAPSLEQATAPSDSPQG